MKTKITFLALALFVHVSLVLAQAEQKIRPSNVAMHGKANSIGLQYGAGFFAFIRNQQTTLTVNINDTDQREYTATFTGKPATSLTYDRQLGKVVSLGGAISIQQNAITNIRNLADDASVTGRIDINRTLVGGRVLFHYGNNQNFDMYSGLRAGLTHWNVKASGEVRDLDFDSRRLGPRVGVVTPQLTFVLFGFNINIDDSFYVGGELGAGSPHIGAIQVGYRF